MSAKVVAHGSVMMEKARNFFGLYGDWARQTARARDSTREI